MTTIRKIEHKGNLVALAVTGTHTDGISFYSPETATQQIGYQTRKAGSKVALHAHERGPTVISNFAEVLIIESGKALVRLFTSEGEHLEDVTLGPKEMILLESGAHEITFLEDTELFEVKQGPYIGRAEKRFIDLNKV